MTRKRPELPAFPDAPRGSLLDGWLGDALGLDRRSLGIFRILIGLIVSWDVFGRLSEVGLLYTDDGVLPRHEIEASLANWWKALPTFWWGTLELQTLFFGFALAIAIAFTLGFATRISAFLLWVIVFSIEARNPLAVHSGDTILRLLLLWAQFLPISDRFSLDALRHGPPPEDDESSLGTVGFKLQMAMMYWFSSTFKTAPEWRTEGSAVYYALNYDLLATDFGKFLGQFDISAVLTPAVFWLEVIGPIFFFSPSRLLRRFGILMFITLHAGFAAALAIGTFPWICIAGLIAMWPGGRAGRFFMPTQSLSRTGTLLAVLLIVYTAAWNVERTLKAPMIPGVLYPFGGLFRLEQEWSMFTPHPPRETGWFVFPAEGREGTRDFFKLLNRRQDLELTYAKPRSVVDTFHSHRINKLMRTLRFPENSRYLEGLGRYLCARWNRAHPEDPAYSIAMEFMGRGIPAPGAEQHEGEPVFEQERFFEAGCADLMGIPPGELLPPDSQGVAKKSKNSESRARARRAY